MAEQSRQNTMQTIKSTLAHASTQIGRFEAFILLAQVLGKPKEFLITHDDDVLEPSDITRFDILVEMRRRGTPIPYITGRQEFFGRYFLVDPSVLIPRPDTEVLIEQAQLVAPLSPKILDLGTGSGCIAITLALEIREARVTATDISEDAIAIAKENAITLGATLNFKQGSWWDPVQEETFDLIVSNPPYIHKNDPHLAALSSEPLSALTDGADGLTCITEITACAKHYLNPNGWLLIEHGYNQGEIVRELFREGGLVAVRTVKDYGGNDRITMGRRAN